MRTPRSLRVWAWLVVLAALVAFPALFGCACGARQAPVAILGLQLAPLCAPPPPLPTQTPATGTPATLTPATLTPGTGTATP